MFVRKIAGWRIIGKNILGGDTYNPDDALIFRYGAWRDCEKKK